ncbi:MULTISPECIES: hypothetical protein [Cellvibrio]|jgi:hypothetical protein|uniref:Uncharacterized protein n=1 Tax=Cellvibrio fibrivorans TaxID=126350 RepID=A0ABU1UUC8_9GAMM|nr:hypothetical protein [Cellvibrio fibrivorans]MDR7088738.1 hypothetical protein [Cellvibrio fibrivorans]
MDTLIFSQTAIFRMQQLASCVYHKTGVRHRMATQDGMLALLREAGASADRDIRQYYDSFVMELNKRQLDMLEARDVSMRKPFYASVTTPIRKAG